MNHETVYAVPVPELSGDLCCFDVGCRNVAEKQSEVAGKPSHSKPTTSAAEHRQDAALSAIKSAPS